MKNLVLSLRNLGGRSVLGVCLASMLVVLASDGRVSAQKVKQGKYISEASDRLIKLVNEGNKEGYSLHNNSFSIGGGWLKQSTDKWIPLYSIHLQEGKKYRFLAAGDSDARDVDLEVLDSKGTIVARDAKADPQAVVDYTPVSSGAYTIRIRLFASRENFDAVCLSVVMSKK